ncbi:hypothetical protein EDC04DRAFT_276625 [Pisolithus marmoratus]|nr:hypothetical protein EDC04DRAFT_276625 [Pisolithus marmoratus]
MFSSARISHSTILVTLAVWTVLPPPRDGMRSIPNVLDTAVGPGRSISDERKSDREQLFSNTVSFHPRFSPVLYTYITYHLHVEGQQGSSSPAFYPQELCLAWQPQPSETDVPASL